MDEAGCIIQREISQTQKDKYCMVYHIILTEAERRIVVARGWRYGK